MLIFSFVISAFCAVVLTGHNAEELEEDIHDNPESMNTMEHFWRLGTYMLKSEKDERYFEHIRQLIEEAAFSKSVPFVKVEKKETPVKDFAQMYNQRVLRHGADDIQRIGEYLRKKLHLEKERVSPPVDEVTYTFTAKLKSAFRFILHKEKYSKFDKQYILIDLVNVARFLLNTVGKALQKKLFALADKPPYQDYKVTTQAILAYNWDFKKTELQYICKKMDVCRPCPAFSDYLASIVNEILKVVDAKLQYVLVKSADLLVSKKNLLKTFLSKRVLKWFLKRAENVGKELIMDMREVFTALRSRLSLRHKMIMLGDGTMKKDTKALRILIDIIDDAFVRNENDYLVIQYDLTVTALQEWVKGSRADIDSTLSLFINYVANTLTMALSDSAKKEIKVLSEIIFDGQPTDQELALYLLENGSKFVSGLDDEVTNNIGNNY